MLRQGLEPVAGQRISGGHLSGEALLLTDRFFKSNRFMRIFIVVLVIFFIAAYGTTVGLYASSGCGCPSATY
jgi:hypothetical protein